MTIVDPTTYTKRSLYMNIPGLKGAGVPVDFTPEMAEEYRRCMADIEYFARNYVKIVTVDRGTVPMEPFPKQLEVWDALNNERFVSILAARQTFKTTTVAVFILWWIVFHADQNVLLLSNKGKGAAMILGRIKTMYHKLPMWMQAGVREWNKTSITLDNATMVQAFSTAAASGRGESANIVYVDEMAFVRDDVEFMTSVMPVVSAGTTSKFIMTSTHNGVATEFYRYWEAAKQGTNKFKAIEVKWYDRPDRDEKFKEEMIANIGILRWRQEFENEALATENTLLDLQKLATTPLPAILRTDQTGVRYYEEPDKAHSYFITADVAEGKAQDASAFSVWRVGKSGKLVQVAAYHGDVLPSDFAVRLVRVASIFNNAFLAIENNSIGALVCHTVFGELSYGNLFMSGSKGYDDLGVRTTARTKHLGCMKLREMFDTGSIEINDAHTVQELMSFERTKNSWAAAKGKHDDLVMTVVLACYLTTDEMHKGLIFDTGFKSPMAAMTPDAFVTRQMQEEMPPAWLLG